MPSFRSSFLAWVLVLSACTVPAPVGPTPQPSAPPDGLANGMPSPTPPPALKAELSGRVFDAQGQPVVGARLRVAGIAEGITDAAGRYQLKGLPPLVNHLVEASAPACPTRSRVAAFVAGPNEAFDFGRAAPIQPLLFPVPWQLAEADANFLEKALELQALTPSQDGQASSSFATELRFAFSEALTDLGAARFVRMLRLWPSSEEATNGSGPVVSLHGGLSYGQSAPSLVAPWAIAHGTSFRNARGLRAEVLIDLDRKGGRFLLPFPLPNARTGAPYQLGVLANEGPIESIGGMSLGRNPQGLPLEQGQAGEVLRGVVFEPEASLAAAPDLPADLARSLGRRSTTWRFQLPQDHQAPKLVGAQVVQADGDLLFKLSFDEPLVVFDPVASQAGGRCDALLHGNGDPLKLFTFAFAKKLEDLEAIHSEGEAKATWDPRTQNSPPERHAELRLAAGARVESLLGAAKGAVMIELPAALPQELWLRVREGAEALEEMGAWALWVGALADPCGNRRSEAQSKAEALRLRL